MSGPLENLGLAGVAFLVGVVGPRICCFDCNCPVRVDELPAAAYRVVDPVVPALDGAEVTVVAGVVVLEWEEEGVEHVVEWEVGGLDLY